MLVLSKFIHKFATGNSKNYHPMLKDFQKELIPIADEDLFVVLNHPNANFDYPVHYHPEYEINLVMYTHGERVIGDSVCPFGEMDLVMTGPNVPHAWRGEIVEGNHVITIQFTESFLGMPILDKRLFAPIKQLLVDSKRGICFSQSSTLLLKDKIIRLTQTKGFQSVLEFLSILYNLAIAEYSILTTNQYNTADVVMTSKSRRIAKVCDYIEKKCYDSISLAEVSSLVGMSESAFSHFFKKKTGGTFIDYLNNLRIAKACQLLAETSNTIAEICYSSGFNNISNFIRMFKKRKGVTPNEYRTMMNQMLIKY